MNADGSEVSAVRRLFETRVPQIASGAVTIRGLARDPGNRSVLVVTSADPATDSVGSCVGNRGAIVKEIVTELHGEYIDIVRWSNSVKEFISNLYSPMVFSNISIDKASHQATGVLRADSKLSSSRAVSLKSRLLRELTGYAMEFEMES